MINVERADIIVTAEIESREILEKPRKGIDGSWLPIRQRFSAKLKDILKNNLDEEIPTDIQFDCGPLTFEEGKIFILFLKNTNKEIVIFKFIDPLSKRVEATKENVNKVKEIIAKQ